MALSISDCDKMIAAAEERGLTLGLCHQNRFNPPVQKLRQALQQDKLGRVINGTACIRWNRNQDYYNQAPWRGTWELDGGTLMNQCLHNIDLLQWMLGEDAGTVFAQTGNFLRDIEAEDFGAIVIRFASGAIGIVEGSACVYPANLEETLNIFGETGTVCIGGIALTKSRSGMCWAKTQLTMQVSLIRHRLWGRHTSAQILSLLLEGASLISMQGGKKAVRLSLLHTSPS